MAWRIWLNDIKSYSDLELWPICNSQVWYTLLEDRKEKKSCGTGRKKRRHWVVILRWWRRWYRRVELQLLYWVLISVFPCTGFDSVAVPISFVLVPISSLQALNFFALTSQNLKSFFLCDTFIHSKAFKRPMSTLYCWMIHSGTPASNRLETPATQRLWLVSFPDTPTHICYHLA